MQSETNHAVDSRRIKSILDAHKSQIRFALSVCVRCSMCAESCFLFETSGGDPIYMPSHKFINSLGYLYKKKGKVTREELESIKEIAWKRCVLCTRCYCPLGVDIPFLISLTRDICRSQDVFREYT
jgi:Fe-S oxidoreductase